MGLTAIWKLISGFIPAKYIYAMVAGLVILISVYFGVRQYSHMVDEIAILTSDKALLQVSVDLQNKTIKAKDEAIDQWEEAQNELIRTIEALAEVSNEALDETRKLNDIFSKHDLTDLSKRKPSIIERRINSGSARSDRLLYCASGGTGKGCPK